MRGLSCRRNAAPLRLLASFLPSFCFALNLSHSQPSHARTSEGDNAGESENRTQSITRCTSQAAKVRENQGQSADAQEDKEEDHRTVLQNRKAPEQAKQNR